MCCRTNTPGILLLNLLLALAACDPLVDRGTLAHTDLNRSGDSGQDVEATGPDVLPADAVADGADDGTKADLEADTEASGDASQTDTDLEEHPDTDISEDICQPNCGGKACGPDGCGGSCGSCPGTCPDGPLGPATQKLVKLAPGTGGFPGQSLDVDGNPATCSPIDECADGIDNMLSGLLGQLSQFVDAEMEMEKALNSGQIMLLLESPTWQEDGKPFLLRLWKATPDLPKEQCDFQADECGFTVAPLPDGSCGSIGEFDNALLSDGVLTAGGPGASAVFYFAITQSQVVPIPVHMVRLVAQQVPSGDSWGLAPGILAGAISKTDLMAAVDIMPDDAGLPVSKDMIKNLLDMFVKPDIDTDDDGELDSASFGLMFQTIPATVAPLAGGIECNSQGQCEPPEIPENP